MKINELYADLRSGWDDWIGFLANPNFIRTDHVITWDRFEKTWSGDIVAVNDLKVLAEKRQWSFQVAQDGALIQLYYAFNKRDGELDEATLGYYALPGAYEAAESQISDGEMQASSEDQDETGEEEIQLRAAEASSGYVLQHMYAYEAIEPDQAVAVRAIRIDYDRRFPESPIHHTCHIHFSGYPATRIAVDGIPTPRQFLEFVFLAFYPDVFRTRRLRDGGEFRNVAYVQAICSVAFPSTMKQLGNLVCHLSFPKY